jgi:hypothetical protein
MFQHLMATTQLLGNTWHKTTHQSDKTWNVFVFVVPFVFIQIIDTNKYKTTAVHTPIPMELKYQHQLKHNLICV